MVLILVVFFAIFRGSVQGGLMGVALGLMEDLMTGRFIGINALCKGLLGYIAGVSERNLYKNNFLYRLWQCWPQHFSMHCCIICSAY